MSSVATALGVNYSDHPLRLAFLKWQCRVRQIAMRDFAGKPDDGATPALKLPGEIEPLGYIVTVMNKAPGYSVTAELNHMRANTHDPAQAREQALQFLSSAYYQKAHEFSDILTATFPPGSPGAVKICEAASVSLVFDAYAQRFDLACRVWRLASHNPLYQATIAHNALFNPDLHPDAEVLGFEPDWDASGSDPKLA